jgi:hypothetical protein
MPGLRIHGDVHSAKDDEGRLVLLNRTTGQWHALNKTGAAFWSALERMSNVEDIVAAMAATYPSVPQHRLRADLETLVSRLVQRGLLVVEVDNRPGKGGTLMVLPADFWPHLGTAQRLAALVAFPLALGLLRLRFNACTNAVAGFKARWCRRSASHQEATDAVMASHWIARHYPGRAACLEHSLTAVLTAAVLRREVDWCFGAAFDPQSLHAWVEVDGQPVTHPTDEPVTGVYHRVLRV